MQQIIIAYREWYTWPGLAILLCLGVFFSVKTVRSCFYLSKFIYRTKHARTKNPLPIQRITTFVLLFWSSLTIGSLWLCYLAVGDAVFGFDEVDISKDRIAIVYQVPHREIKLKWSVIKQAQLTDMGERTAVLEIIGDSGQHWKSARSDVDTLNEAMMMIEKCKTDIHRGNM